jgi:hypothetical protein
MGMGSQALGDQSEPIQPQGVHDQAAERGDDLNIVALAIAVGVLAELVLAGPVQGLLDAPAVSHLLQQGLGVGASTRDVWPPDKARPTEAQLVSVIETR